MLFVDRMCSQRNGHYTYVLATIIGVIVTYSSLGYLKPITTTTTSSTLRVHPALSDCASGGGKDETDQSNMPVIYFITPTYTRLMQKAELTRVSQLLRLIPKVHWIVVEDSANKTKLVANTLNTSKSKYTHLAHPAPKNPVTVNGRCMSIERGDTQRNLAMDWLRKHLNPDIDKGVVFFGDDDNTYTAELFEEMRYTKKVSVWPVGLVGGLRYESPIVKDGMVVGWHAYYARKERRYPIDMAGFAVNLKLILQNKNIGFFCTTLGYAESKFLETVNVTLNELEPKANMCTKVLVWHTQSKTPTLVNEAKMKAEHLEQSDPNIEV